MCGYRKSRSECSVCCLNSQSEKKDFLKGDIVKFHDDTQTERHKHSEVRDPSTANNKKEEATSFEHDYDHICTGTSSMSDIEKSSFQAREEGPVTRRGSMVDISKQLGEGRSL